MQIGGRSFGDRGLHRGARKLHVSCTSSTPHPSKKYRAAPNIVRKACPRVPLFSRWSAILPHATQHAFAASLLDFFDCAGTTAMDVETPHPSARFFEKRPSNPFHQPSPIPSGDSGIAGDCPSQRSYARDPLREKEPGKKRKKNTYGGQNQLQISSWDCLGFFPASIPTTILATLWEQPGDRCLASQRPIFI